MGIITLCTDFGNKGPYVGVMKGVILGVNPEVRIVDITHEIEAQDIRETAFVLHDYWRYFPAGTIHIVIVDPTVGSPRRPIVIFCAGHIFVGPDNGVFSFVAEGASEVRVIDNRDLMLSEISATFHGRDIFSPAASHLSRGVDPAALGTAIMDPIILGDIHPVITGNSMVGNIARFDHFGNAITNIEGEYFTSFVKDRAYRISVNEFSFTSLGHSYFEGEMTCLTGSSGYIEFGIFEGNFRTRTGARKRDPATVTLQ